MNKKNLCTKLLLLAVVSVGLSSCGESEYVDLGLPSGTLWAKCNVGAATPEAAGDYYAWGETDVKSVYNDDNYKYSEGRYTFDAEKLLKYNANDNKVELELADDVANLKLGGQWRMPSAEEFEELKSQCTWTWNAEKKGYDIKSKTNENSIFLPAAGGRNHTEDVVGLGKSGNYWSRSVNERSGAGYAAFLSLSETTGINVLGSAYTFGYSVRPVYVK